MITIEYIKTPLGWEFTIENGKTKSVSRGYPNRKLAKKAANEIIEAWKQNHVIKVKKP